jgi:hypothetical protein
VVKRDAREVEYKESWVVDVELLSREGTDLMMETVYMANDGSI